MIRSLDIKNLAIVSDTHIDFHDGFTVITGESGSGKSIICDAIDLIRGEKASNDMIRHGEQMASISADFVLSDPIPELCQPYVRGPIPQLRITRYLYQTQRSRCEINGQASSLATLKVLGNILLSVQAQHAQTQLLSEHYYLDCLDSLIGDEIDTLLQEYRPVWEDYEAARQEENELLAANNMDANYRAFLAEQVEEIRSYKFKNGEEEDLHTQRQAAKLQHVLGEARSGIPKHIHQIQSDWESVSQYLNQLADASTDSQDDSYETLRQEGQSLEVAIEEWGRSVQQAFSKIPEESMPIDDIESRLDQVFRLKQKYKVANLNELLEKAEKLAQQCQSESEQEASLSALRDKVNALELQVDKIAQKLHRVRLDAAKKLSARLSTACQRLSIPHAQCQFQVQKSELRSPNGYSSVDLLFSANPDIPLKALRQIGSGGELSRVQIALQALAPGPINQSILLDEVDTGLGGITATTIAKAICEMASTGQVIAITHLASIAQEADQHLWVEKSVENKETKVRIHNLNDSEKQRELERMLGGESVLSRLRP